MKTHYLALTVLATLLTIPTASAGTMRCDSGAYLVKIGDEKTDILQNCGQPVMRDAFCSPRSYGTCENVEELTYNPGSGQFMTTLRFVEGKLREIRYGKRVP